MEGESTSLVPSRSIPQLKREAANCAAQLLCKAALATLAVHKARCSLPLSSRPGTSIFLVFRWGAGAKTPGDCKSLVPLHTYWAVHVRCFVGA
jgi:hypothetical protein